MFFAKPMNRMGLTSFPDYYRLRFGRQVEVAASVLLIVGFCILWPAIWWPAGSC